MRKIVLFGDSLLGRMNIGLIKQLEKKCKDIIILNCATGGMSTKEALDRISFLSEINHDYTVISLGGNDILRNKLSTEDYLKNMTKIISYLNKSKIIIWLNPPADDKSDIDGTKKFNKKIKSYYTKLKDLFESKVIFINSFEEYKDIQNFDELHGEDGIHLTDEGYLPFINSLSEILK